MTTEQMQYGGGWETCTRCGCRDRVDQLVKREGLHGPAWWIHPDAQAGRCAEWKRQREAAARG